MEEVEELSLEDLRRKLQRREEDAPYLRAIDDVVRRRLHGDTPCELLPSSSSRTGPRPTSPPSSPRPGR